ncbi:MAG: NUDIX domain-containing protein [Terriglobales bacterium]
MGRERSVKSSPTSRLPGSRKEVAAVCYRMRKGGIEFLLVQTRGGRWIFPKGGVEPGLTDAQSAALEAFEEAGVHGRMEAISFARYFKRREPASAAKDVRAGFERGEPSVKAHLCEVSRLEPSQESNRNPSWFTAEKTKQRLLKDRAPEFGAELVRVVERALSRIRRLKASAHHIADGRHSDGLQKVRFEFHEDGAVHDDLRKAVLARYIFRHPSALGEIRRPVLRLSSGANSTTETARNITAIDSGRRANFSSRRKVRG